MKIVAIKERALNEKRVAITPVVAKLYSSLGIEVYIEKDCGLDANFSNEQFETVGAKIFSDVNATLKKADIVVKIQPSPFEDEHNEIAHMQNGAILIGTLSPFHNQALLAKCSERHLTSFSLDLLPRITRAQEMDVLSSQSNLMGYRAVIDASFHYKKIFPMLMTSAGTIFPAKILVLGTGVAGLQAIATAKRLGGVVTGFDIRAAARESVESLGAKFVTPDVGDLENKEGYAKAASTNQQLMIETTIAEEIKKADIVITTALIPGRNPPVLITKAMVESMRPGSVIVDLVAAQGGNCALSKVEEIVEHNNVKIIGHANYASLLAEDTSNFYARNAFNFIKLIYSDKTKELNIDTADEIIKATLLTHQGKIVHKLFN